jgi:hypothetical protein
MQILGGQHSMSNNKPSSRFLALKKYPHGLRQRIVAGDHRASKRVCIMLVNSMTARAQHFRAQRYSGYHPTNCTHVKLESTIKTPRLLLKPFPVL